MEYQTSADDVRCLLLAMINQAIWDFRYSQSHKIDRRSIVSQDDAETARAFLFEPDYTIDYGDRQLTLVDICTVLEIQVADVRNQANQRLGPVARKKASVA